MLQAIADVITKLTIIDKRTDESVDISEDDIYFLGVFAAGTTKTTPFDPDVHINPCRWTDIYCSEFDRGQFIAPQPEPAPLPEPLYEPEPQEEAFEYVPGDPDMPLCVPCYIEWWNIYYMPLGYPLLLFENNWGTIGSGANEALGAANAAAAGLRRRLLEFVGVRPTEPPPPPPSSMKFVYTTDDEGNVTIQVRTSKYDTLKKAMGGASLEEEDEDEERGRRRLSEDEEDGAGPNAPITYINDIPKMAANKYPQYLNANVEGRGIEVLVTFNELIDTGVMYHTIFANMSRLDPSKSGWEFKTLNELHPKLQQMHLIPMFATAVDLGLRSETVRSEMLKKMATFDAECIEMCRPRTSCQELCTDPRVIKNKNLSCATLNGTDAFIDYGVRCDGKLNEVVAGLPENRKRILFSYDRFDDIRGPLVLTTNGTAAYEDPTAHEVMREALDMDLVVRNNYRSDPVRYQYGSDFIALISDVMMNLYQFKYPGTIQTNGTINKPRRFMGLLLGAAEEAWYWGLAYNYFPSPILNILGPQAFPPVRVHNVTTRYANNGQQFTTNTLTYTQKQTGRTTQTCVPCPAAPLLSQPHTHSAAAPTQTCHCRAKCTHKTRNSLSAHYTTPHRD